MFTSKITSMPTREGAGALFAACALTTCLLAAAPAEAADAIPAAAAGAGYRMETLASDTFGTKSVDMKMSYGRGYQWYFYNFFGVSPISASTSFNSDGSLNTVGLIPGWAGFGANIASAGVSRTGPGFVGTAYGGGGYFEATLSFDNTKVNLNNGWPSFWSMALEHMIFKGDQWAGQAPGYEHYIEPDFFEYDGGVGPYYGGDIHDWYGINNKTCSGGYCNQDLPWSSGSNGYVARFVPSNTVFTQYHKYGFLWKPATATARGALSYYFDGKQVGTTTFYTKFVSQAPKPTTATPWTFGIIDKQHLVLTFGSAAPAPMKVRSVQVWQASAVNNMHN
jgi:hypothetical protein